jgi:hypothetical protein
MSVLQLQQQNIAAPAAFTEYSVVIPPGIKQVTLQLHVNDTLYWYTSPSGSASPGSAANLPAVYNTLPPGGSRTFPGIGAQTIYFQVATSQAGQALEVDYYGDN